MNIVNGFEKFSFWEGAKKPHRQQSRKASKEAVIESTKPLLYPVAQRNYQPPAKRADSRVAEKGSFKNAQPPSPVVFTVEKIKAVEIQSDFNDGDMPEFV